MIDPHEVEPTPWRNGGGLTRELASGVDPDGVMRWRVSVATLEADAAFSVFAEMDRIFVPFGPARLTVDGGDRELAAGEQVRFPGEASVSVTVEAPTTALNVMTRRGRSRAFVKLRDPADDSPGGVAVSVLLPEAVADIVLLTEEPHA